jgi:hypothetical protein
MEEIGGKDVRVRRAVSLGERLPGRKNRLLIRNSTRGAEPTPEAMVSFRIEDRVHVEDDEDAGVFEPRENIVKHQECWNAIVLATARHDAI